MSKDLNHPIEILSPAGDLTRFKAAVDFGADAVYFGGKQFGMRAAPGNLTADEMKTAVSYAHTANKKAYLTLNTLPRNDELPALPQFIETAADAGVDAFIVTDVGCIDLVKKYAPHCELHISVQTGIVNYQSAMFYYNLGANRVVLARELTLEEIAQIRAQTPQDLELEAFVHGSICMSVSGRCLLSDYLTGRDANRGDCAQPCRWKYRLVEEKRPGEYMPVVQEDTGSYILNAKDLCLIEHLPELYQAGITSFKIEGRAKTEYYTAAVTYAYRQAADGFINSGYSAGYRPDPAIVEEVYKISHRVYSTGFYFGTPRSGQVYDNGGYIREYELIGVVQDYQDGIATVLQRNKFYPGNYDVLEPGRQFLITVDALFDKDMQQIESAKHAAQIVKFKSPPLKKGAFLRIQK